MTSSVVAGDNVAIRSRCHLKRSQGRTVSSASSGCCLLCCVSRGHRTDHRGAKPSEIEKSRDKRREHFVSVSRTERARRRVRREAGGGETAFQVRPPDTIRRVSRAVGDSLRRASREQSPDQTGGPPASSTDVSGY